MSYSRTVPVQCLVQRIGTAGAAVWFYRSADARTSVEATDYFTDGKRDGMKQGDIVFVVYTTGEVATIHSVLAVDADGNASISAAVLA